MYIDLIEGPVKFIALYLLVRMCGTCTTPQHYVYLQALKAAFTEQATATAAQQDVSEFTHKLLEWIEIAFKTASGNDE